jgi:hypothetical protein
MKTTKAPFIQLAAAVSLAAGTFASAAPLMSKSYYEASKSRIEADGTAAKERCKSFVANARDICLAEAKGRERIAVAELEEAYQPSDKARYETLVARAKASHGVARQKCDEVTGNTKDVCLKRADSAEALAMAEAKAKSKAWEANKVADAKTAKAVGESDAKIADARKDVAAAKREGEHAVAKEKCDAYVGGTKEACLKDAKAAYGKP